MIDVKIMLKNGVDMPKYQTTGSSGFDLAASEESIVDPNKTILIPTGLYMEIPQGYELQIRPRSGLSLTTDLIIKNSPGTIDSRTNNYSS